MTAISNGTMQKMTRETSRSKIIAIVGQTATGKSALAVTLARKFGGEVVSADSRQVYTGLDVGTGKVTHAEMKGIRHHLLDVADPRKPYSVAEYQHAALDHIRYIVTRGKLPILCGGTGFYIQAVIDGIILPDVKPDMALRATLEEKTTDELWKMLKRLDPRRAASIDQKNPRRLIRAIEIAKSLGSVPKLTKPSPKYDVLFIGLMLPPETLKKKIEKRLSERLKKGAMIAEAMHLHAKGLSWRRMEELGLEYRYLARYLQGKISRPQMEQAIIQESLQYAKRQMTWFKRDARIAWFSPSETKDIVRKVETFFS